MRADPVLRALDRLLLALAATGRDAYRADPDRLDTSKRRAHHARLDERSDRFIEARRHALGAWPVSSHRRAQLLGEAQREVVRELLPPFCDVARRRVSGA